MGKDYIETIPRQVKDAELASDAIDHTAISDSFIYLNSGDPAASNDTGEGYVLGSLWVNTTSGQQFICTATTAEDATWINQEGDDVNPPFVMQGTTYGWVAAGGTDPGGPAYYGSNNITRFSFTAPESGTAVGELSFNNQAANNGSMRSDTLALVIGGYQSHPSAYPGHQPGSAGTVDTMDSFTFTSPSTVTDIGEYGVAVSATASTTDGTTGFVMGGDNNSSVKTDVTTRMPLTSPHPMSDNGELSAVTGQGVGLTDLTYAFRVAGSSPPSMDTVEKMAFATTSGPFTDVGEISRATHGLGGCNGPTKGFVAGGGPPPLTARSDMETFTFASPFTSVDVGELDSQRAYTFGCSSTDYGFFVGGAGPASDSVTVDTISTIPWSATSGGSTDFGELSNHTMNPSYQSYGANNMSAFESN